MALTAVQLDAVPRDIDRYFEMTYLNLVFSVYAGVLAGFVVWRVGREPAGRYLALLLACVSGFMALTVVPSGEAGLGRTVVFTAFQVGAFVQGLRFWSTFPREMTPEGLARLARREGRGLLARLNRLSARAVAWVLGTLWGRAAFGAGATVFGAWIAWPGTFRYNMSETAVRMAIPLAPLFSGIALLVILVSVGFAWTSYRLADEEGRRKVLWIVLAQVTIAVWLFMDVGTTWLADLTESGVVGAVNWFFRRTTHALVWFVNLTGFALAVFIGGVLDLRPVISKTTLYGASLVTLTVVFALVEEVVQSQLAERLGMPEGLGTWLGAAAVAVAIGPVRTRFEGAVHKAGAALESGGESSASEAVGG